MDDYIFKRTLDRCKFVHEYTSYLEMFSFTNYLPIIEESRLDNGEFMNFVLRKGVFGDHARRVRENGSCTASLRMVLQLNARHPETFTPNVLSLKLEYYEAMVEAFHLPRTALESTSCVGPFFWCALDQDDENPHLQMVYRKSDVRKKGYTRGWELILSHELKTGITSGFCKGTPSTEMVECIKHLKACISEIGHPMLLPVIVHGQDSSWSTDTKQRDARDWLRRLEYAISMRSDRQGEIYERDGVVDLDAVNRDLVECHAQVLWKRPVSYLEILQSFEEAAATFFQRLPDNRMDSSMKKLHARIISRLGFYKKRWQGLETYAATTIQRLEIQRNALYNIIAQKESKLNFQMATDQRKLANASKRDSTAMKSISLLGAVFLPGAYLASIFSTTFFDFKEAPDMASVVSPRFWLYWVVTIPITALIVGLWYAWERRRARRHEREDGDVAQSSEVMEKTIMSQMRQRTTTTTDEADARKERKEKLAKDEENDYGGFKDPKKERVKESSTHLVVPEVEV